jgi:flagellar motor switch protein FliM
VRLVVGAYAARARFDEGGHVTLAEHLAPSPGGARGTLHDDRIEREDAMERRAGGDPSGEATTTRTVDVAAVLGAASLEVVAELGRIVMRGDEVAGLGPGAVLALGRFGASPVSLRVGGEVWAEGELVDVEGELGVRVTAVRRPGAR